MRKPAVPCLNNRQKPGISIEQPCGIDRSAPGPAGADDITWAADFLIAGQGIRAETPLHLRPGCHFS